MSNKFKFLTMVSLKKKIQSKWFVAVNIILAVIIIGLLNIDTIVTSFGGDFNEPIKVKVIADDSMYQMFESNIKNMATYLEKGGSKIEIAKSELTFEEEKKAIENDKTLVVELNNDTKILKAKIVSKAYVDTLPYQTIVAALDGVKNALVLSESNLTSDQIKALSSATTIERSYLDEEKNEKSENLDLIVGVVFPALILPFFMLIIFLVQMIGAEVNEEKATRGMEIIISNVSPKTHFFAKVLAANAFVIIQGILFFTYAMIAFKVRDIIGNSDLIDPSSLGFNIGDIWKQLEAIGFVDRLPYVIPLSLVILLLSFLAYSLIAGILASMTTNMEDFQQIQTPIMLVLVIGYYLASLGTVFDGAVFIKAASYIPFVSAILAPSLLISGEIGVVDVYIAIALLALVNYLLIKYGLKVYKEGILNYSSNKLWTKIFKALKH